MMKKYYKSILILLLSSILGATSNFIEGILGVSCEALSIILFIVATKKIFTVYKSESR